MNVICQTQNSQSQVSQHLRFKGTHTYCPKNNTESGWGLGRNKSLSPVSSFLPPFFPPHFADELQMTECLPCWGLGSVSHRRHLPTDCWRSSFLPFPPIVPPHPSMPVFAHFVKDYAQRTTLNLAIPIILLCCAPFRLFWQTGRRHQHTPPQPAAAHIIASVCSPFLKF
jgi:hypothetical protein